MSVSAFALSLNTIATCTIAYTAVLHGRFDPFAETAYLFMKREFLYEFTMVRWSFLSSVFCFLGMLASRLLIEFELLKPTGDVKSSRPDVARLVVFSIGALVTSLLSYVNQNLWCWESLIGMTITIGQVSLLLKIPESSFDKTFSNIFFISHKFTCEDGAKASLL